MAMASPILPETDGTPAPSYPDLDITLFGKDDFWKYFSSFPVTIFSTTFSGFFSFGPASGRYDSLSRFL
jgi:hypothetical protein